MFMWWYCQLFGLGGYGGLDGDGYVICVGQIDFGQWCVGGWFDDGGVVCGFFLVVMEQVVLLVGRIK